MAKVYIIPENFIEGGRVLNMFRVRNFVEAIAITLAVGIPLWLIPYPSFQVKLMVVLCITAPLFLIAATGINGDSLIQFLQQYLKWRKAKRIMLYNAQARPREVRAADVMMAQELAKDKIVTAVENWQEKRRLKNTDISFVEGRDFVFIDDEENYSAYVSTERKLIDTNTNDNNTASNEDTKKRKRSHRHKKDTKLLNAPSSATDEQELMPNDDFVLIDNDNDDLIIEGEVLSVE